MHSVDDNAITREQITDVKEMMAQLEERVADLKGPATNVKEMLGDAGIGGILGAALGESSAETAARVEEAKKGANDLTGLIKRKKPVHKEEDKATPAVTNGKRKLEEDVEEGGGSKKIKVEATNGKIVDDVTQESKTA